MPKKSTKPETTDADVQAAEETLKGILQQLDTAGVLLVEENWRAMTESENRSATEWAAARRIGKKSPLPLCLMPFASDELKAEQDQYLASQEEGRKVLAPCVFCKPSFDKSEEGDETVKLKFKVSDSNMSGSTAREMLGKTRVLAEFSRRPIGEWGQTEIIADGPRRIVVCETEVASFSWSDGNWQFAFLISADKFSLEDAIECWKEQGSIRLQVIGAAVEEPGDRRQTEPDAPAPKKPKKTKEPKPKQPKPGAEIPGTTADDLAENYSVGLTDRYRLDVKVSQQSDGKFCCQWDGFGPAGDCEQGEPSVRSSEKEAVSSSIGNAVDYWGVYPEDEAKEIVVSLKHWLCELEAKKTPKQIEFESADNEEESAVAGRVG